MHLPLPSSLQTKLAWANLALAAAPLVMEGASKLMSGNKKPAAPAAPAGPSLAKTASATNGFAGSATMPQGSTSKPKGTPVTQSPGADEAFTPTEYGQNFVPPPGTPPKMKKIGVQLDTAINAVSALAPIAYDATSGKRQKRQEEDAEIEHLEAKLGPSKKSVSLIAHPIDATKDYLEGAGHAGLDALTEAQRAQMSTKHLAQPEARRKQV